MKRIAIYTEGQSELIFTRDLILKLFNYEGINLRCHKLHQGRVSEPSYIHKVPDPDYFFQIINVGGDEKVLNYIVENAEHILSKDFESIIGIRDMYSLAYRKSAQKNIDDELNQKFIIKHNEKLDTLNDRDKIQMFFAIMEYETWLLSMPNLFQKIDAALTIQFITDNLGYELTTISPEEVFFHPYTIISRLFNLVGIDYDKSADITETIVATIQTSDYQDALEEQKCPSFQNYYNFFNDLLQALQIN